VQHPVGDHALVADGRTAALIAPDGNIAWLPWPRVDSPPCLLALLDDVVGGMFIVSPADAAATVVERSYLPGSLVLRTVWATADGELVAHDALAWDGPPRLVRTLRATTQVEVVVRVSLAPDAARSQSQVRAEGTVLRVRDGAALDVAVHAPNAWTVGGDGVATTRLTAVAEPQAVVLCDAAISSPSPSLEPTMAAFAASVPHPAQLSPSSMAVQVLGDSASRALVRQSAAVLVGLRQRGGGIVAAPTTSIPQWPGSARTWDYRYSWLRDTALAGLAMLRVGLLEEAVGVGEFLGAATISMPPPVLLRVDGTPPPHEQTLDHLRGYRGSRPVRIGNAASEQPQLDVAGEVLELAASLAAQGALPVALRDGVARVADWAAAHWTDPDHGIWEIRGVPRHYTHSRVMAWAGLRRAVELATAGVVTGDAPSWQSAADAIRSSVVAGDGALQLTDTGGGPDAALAQAVTFGLFDDDDPRAAATVDSIVRGLDRGGLVDRHDPREDPSTDPCGPFLFPTFWLADALQRCGRDGSAFFAAAVSARGAVDLFGEVAEPVSRTPLGNYPQVQSHASFVLAATDPAGGAAVSRTGSGPR
jgi:GH15 family glucan-1,4-alpha-glucosidase